VYAHAERVYVDGALVHDRAAPASRRARTSCSASRREVPCDPRPRPQGLRPPARRGGAAGHGAAQDLLIRNATVHTVTERGTLERTDVLVQGGRIAAVGTGLAAAGATVVEANGRPLTPGLFAASRRSAWSRFRSNRALSITHRRRSARATVRQPSRIRVRRDAGVQPGLAGHRREPRRGHHLRDGGAERPAGCRRGLGQGAVARLDGRADAFAATSRTLFADLGVGAPAAGVGRAAQFMLLEQAVREAKPPASMRDGDFRLLTPAGARCWRVT